MKWGNLVDRISKFYDNYELSKIDFENPELQDINALFGNYDLQSYFPLYFALIFKQK